MEVIDEIGKGSDQEVEAVVVVVREEQVEIAVCIVKELAAAATVAKYVERAGGRRVENCCVVLLWRDRLDL